MSSHDLVALIQLVGFQMLLYAGMWVAAYAIVGEERAAVRHWLAFSLLSGLGLLLIGLRPHGHPWVTHTLPNLCFVLSFVAVRRGSELFLRMRPLDLEHAVLTGGAVSMLLLVGPDPADVAPRVATVSGVAAWVLLRSSWVGFAPVHQQFGERTAWAATLVPALFGLLHFLRMARAVASPEQSMELDTPVLINQAVLYFSMVAAAVFNLLFLFLIVLRLMARLTYLAQRDPLTGLLNRRAMQGLLEREWQRYARLRQSFALISLDVDHFKRVNDHHGHEAGDRALVHVAQLLQGQARELDGVARMGGEEFLLILPGHEVSMAAQAAERLRQALAGGPVMLREGLDWPLTASFGVAAPRPGDHELEDVLRRADEALYRAKAAGRNRVVVQPPGSSDHEPVVQACTG